MCDLAINARDYGAVGDGQTDDTAAIEDALAALSAASGSTGSGILFLPAGTYATTGITLPKEKRVMLMGTGAGSSTLFLIDGSDTSVLTTEARSSAANGWWHEICHLGIEGNGTNQASGHGIKICSTRTFVHHCYIAHACQNGLHNEGSASYTAHNDFFSDLYIYQSGGAGMYFNRYAQDPHLHNLWVVDNAGSGIKSEAVVPLASNFHIADNGGYGIELVGVVAGYGQWSVGYVDNNAMGGIYINSTGERGHSFGQVMAIRNSGFGAHLEADAGYGGAHTFTGCRFQNNIGPGIEIVDCNQNQIVGCHFYDTQGTKTQTYAVTSSGTANYNQIVGCQIRAANHSVGSTSLVGSSNVSTGNVT